MGEQYLVILGWGMPLLFFSVISRNVFHASGDTVRPMIFILISQVINAVLDPFFIFGIGFFPEMGVRGAALASIISMSVGSLLALIYILAGKTAYQLQWRHCIPNWPVIKEIYRIGLPSMLMETTESVCFALFNHVAAGYGSMVLAAVGIATRIADLAFMPIIGTAHGLLPIVGFSLGARLWNRLWSAVKMASLGLALIMICATVLLEIFTPEVVRIFNTDPELVNLAVPGMRIFYASFPLIGPTIIFITTFQGLSKGKDAMVLSLTRQFVYFLPGLFLLSHFYGLTGVWVAMPVSDTLGALTAGLWLLREYRNQKKSGIWNLKPVAAEVKTGPAA
jgi:putative MATE family efflux protein